MKFSWGMDGIQSCSNRDPRAAHGAIRGGEQSFTMGKGGCKHMTTDHDPHPDGCHVQYGRTPVVYGPTFCSSPVEPYISGPGSSQEKIKGFATSG
ncbi:hypothetical protein QG37_04995 [Candidozyma auris]|nr:hypothetical protein QG37_04995 [[Candida] auris]